MTFRFKLSLIVLLTLLWSGVFRFSFWLLNMPNDGAFYSGIAVMLASVIVFPNLYARIVRKKKENEPQEPHPPTAA